MLAGRLDRRIAIQRASFSTNALNEKVATWPTVATVWASAMPVSDGERLRTGETISDRMMRFQIRYSAAVADVDPRDRVLFDGRVYDISGVKEIGRREGLEITATARGETP